MYFLGYVYFPISMSFHRDGNLLATGETFVGIYVKLYGVNNYNKTWICKFISQPMGLLGCKGFDNIGSTIKLWDIRKWW